MMEFVYFASIILLSEKYMLAEGEEVDYCSLCKKQGTHTMCDQKLRMNGAGCIGVTNALLSDKDIEDIVALHNGWRNIVALGISTLSKTKHQPPAANMEELVWNDELANSAQRWANQCISFQASKQHDECRLKSDGAEVGQNIATSISYEIEARSDLPDTIFSWMKESYNVKEEDINSFEQARQADGPLLPAGVGRVEGDRLWQGHLQGVCHIPNLDHRQAGMQLLTGGKQGRAQHLQPRESLFVLSGWNQVQHYV